MYLIYIILFCINDDVKHNIINHNNDAPCLKSKYFYFNFWCQPIFNMLSMTYNMYIIMYNMYLMIAMLCWWNNPMLIYEQLLPMFAFLNSYWAISDLGTL